MIYGKLRCDTDSWRRGRRRGSVWGDKNEVGVDWRELIEGETAGKGKR